MKLNETIQISTITFLMAIASVSAEAAKGGNGGGKKDEGQADIVVTVESTDPEIWSSVPGATEIPSHGVSQGQVVFYDVTMNMEQFGGDLDNGPSCNHGIRDGILVIESRPRTGPVVAQLLFWFNSELESGDGVTHLLRMDGEFLAPQNWPPAPGTSSIVEFNFWEFFAENKKAQRQDCAGESVYPLPAQDRLYFIVSQATASE
jgi:hypothetical protein